MFGKLCKRSTFLGFKFQQRTSYRTLSLTAPSLSLATSQSATPKRLGDHLDIVTVTYSLYAFAVLKGSTLPCFAGWYIQEREWPRHRIFHFYTTLFNIYTHDGFSAYRHAEDKRFPTQQQETPKYDNSSTGSAMTGRHRKAGVSKPRIDVDQHVRG